MDIKPKTTCLALAMLAALAGMADDVVIENGADESTTAETENPFPSDLNSSGISPTPSWIST